MKNMKSVLALLVALCMMVCLAVPAFAAASEEPVADAEVLVGEAAPDAAADEEAPAEDAVKEDAPVEDGAAAEDTTTTGATEEKKSGGVLRTIIIVLEVIASVALILVVLLQSGKESGLSGAIAGNSDSYMNKSKMGGLDQKLAGATKWIALAWILLTLVLCLIP